MRKSSGLEGFKSLNGSKLLIRWKFSHFSINFLQALKEKKNRVLGSGSVEKGPDPQLLFYTPCQHLIYEFLHPARIRLLKGINRYSGRFTANVFRYEAPLYTCLFFTQSLSHSDRPSLMGVTVLLSLFLPKISSSDIKELLSVILYTFSILLSVCILVFVFVCLIFRFFIDLERVCLYACFLISFAPMGSLSLSLLNSCLYEGWKITHNVLFNSDYFLFNPKKFTAF